MKSLLLLLIRFYRKYLSFDRGVLMILAPTGACKYEISCSEYTYNAVYEFGVFRGLVLGLKRILSCK